METDELYQEIRMLFTIVAKKAMHAVEKRLASTDASVTGLQFGILLALSFEQHTISDLSRHFMLDPSTLVPAVDALERKGYAKRGRDPQDRRRVPISLTERGVELLSCVPLVDGDDPLFHSLNLLGDEQRQQLLTLMRELVGHMPEGDTILEHVSSRMDWIQSHTRRDTA